MRGSYTSDGQGLRDTIRQATLVTRLYSDKIESRVTEALSLIKQVERTVFENYGMRLCDLRVLEVGPGQFYGQLAYLAVRNRVTGVDRDEIVQGFNPAKYVRTLLANGIMRTAKTLGRKMLGFDQRYRKELCKQLGVSRLPNVDLRRGEATALPFGSSEFDFVYSRAVFQHLPAPADVVREMVRVLRPGGVLYVSLQPYTSPTGCLDPRVLYGGIENDLGLWPHLRPELRDKVRPNAYINKLGLRDWMSLFTSLNEDAKFIVTPTDERYVALGNSLKQAGHLKEYTIEELTGGALDVMFQRRV